MLLTPGTVLQQRYEIERPIGRGGMSAVYAAIDRRWRERVALKHLIVDAQVDTDTERHWHRAFEQEAQLLQMLRHSALPRIIDHFTEPAGQFLVMGYVEGLDLDALLTQRGAAFPVEQVLGWAEQLLDALGYLHSRTPPVLHGDIKPQNLKLTPDGKLFLLDFGLARGTQIMTGTTLLNVAGYTPHYAPLEQIQGGGTSERSDIYTVAATLYHLLTGTPPPDALVRAAAVLQGQPDPLVPAAVLSPAIPPKFSVALQQALSLYPHDRPASAQALRTALRQLAITPHQPAPLRKLPISIANTGRTIRVVPAPPPQTTAPQLTRRGKVVGFMLLAFIFTLGLMGRNENGPRPEPTHISRPNSTSNAVTLPVSTSSDHGLAAETMAERLGSGKLIYSSDDDLFVVRTLLPRHMRIVEDIGDRQFPAWSYDRGQIAYASNRDGNYEIYVADYDGTGPVRITHNSVSDEHPTWSPDMKHIAFSSYRDGNWDIYVVATNEDGEIRLTYSDAASIQPAWSPDGQHIAFASDRTGSFEIYVMNADGSNPVQLTSHHANSTNPSWSPDSQQIAFTSDHQGHQSIYTINVEGSHEARLTAGTSENDYASWSPDGQHIAFASTRDHNWEIYVMDANGDNVRRLTKNMAVDTHPAWSEE